MLPDPQDPIVALSTAPGSGGRAIIRLTGSSAVRIAASGFDAGEPIRCDERRCYAGSCRLPGVTAPLPADLYIWPAPRTYTGQELAELHTLSCPPLVDLLVTQLLKLGARAAQPGEFTLRAFLAGKLDLTRAEAVLAVIEAGTRDELHSALRQLAGGIAHPLQELRRELLDLLADVEAGLDFAEEDTQVAQFADPRELLKRLSKGLALVTLLGKQLDQRSLGDRRFRVVLAGRPNAGKSSLFNLLGDETQALVSPRPGTTRDYLMKTVELPGARIELVDTAGWQKTNGSISEQAQVLGREQAEMADLILLCLEAGQPLNETETLLLGQKLPPVVGVSTKCDLGPSQSGFIGTSAVTFQGLPELRNILVEQARSHARPALAPSLARCRHHVSACLESLRLAHQVVVFEEPPEIVAMELRAALNQLGEMVGAVYTDDLLDRIFSRFCIGK
jgi:tRNA modification GTPase